MLDFPGTTNRTIRSCKRAKLVTTKLAGKTPWLTPSENELNSHEMNCYRHPLLRFKNEWYLLTAAQTGLRFFKWLDYE